MFRLSDPHLNIEVPPYTETLANLYQRLTGLEAKWLTRIILNDTQIDNLQKERVFDMIGMVHSWFPFLYSYRFQLPAATTTIIALSRTVPHDQLDKLTDSDRKQVFKEFAKPLLGTPVQYMSALPVGDAEEMWRLIQGQDFAADIKYDGERMQIHYDSLRGYDEQVVIYSKSRRNSTLDRIHSIPIVRACLGGTLNANDAAYLARFGKTSWDFKPLAEVKNCIIEAELMIFNEEKNEVEPFGSTRDFLSRNGSEYDDKRHCFIVFFDILWLDDEDCMYQPFQERRNLLSNIITCIPRFCMIAKMTTFSPSRGVVEFNRFKDYYLGTIINREEGLVIRKVDGRYVRGKKGYCWKMKAKYVAGVSDTFDMVVVGGSFCPKTLAENGISMDRVKSYMKNGVITFLSTFFLAVVKNRDDKRPCYKIVSNTLKALNAADLIAFNDKLESHKLQQIREYNKVPFGKRHTLPYEFSISPNCDKKEIDYFFFRPLVVEVASDCIHRRHEKDIFTLRFPELVSIRPEKSPVYDVLSLKDWEEIGVTAQKGLTDEQIERAMKAIESYDRGEYKKRRVVTRGDTLLWGSGAQN